MSDKVQYEPVPHDELQDYQKFHINKEKSSEIDPSVGGVTAEALGIPAIAGAKTLKSLLGSSITKHAINWAENQLAPKGTVPPVAPPPEVVTPQGGGAWNQTLTGNTAPGSQMNKKSFDINQRMMETVGPGGELAGGKIYKGSVMVPPGVELPAGAPPPEPPPLTAGQRALQTIKNIPGTEMASKVINNPLVRGAGNVGALWQGGEDAMRLWNHLGKDFGRSAMDTASLASNIATIAPTPASPWSNIAGAAASIPLGYYQRKWDAEDKAKREAGGLETLR